MRALADARVERHELRDVDSVGLELVNDGADGAGGLPVALDAAPVGRNLNGNTCEFFNSSNSVSRNFGTGRGVRSATGLGWLRFGMFHHPDGQ